MAFIVIAFIFSLVFLPHMRGMYRFAADAALKENMFQLKIAAEDFSTMALGLYPSSPTNTVSQVLSDMGISSTNQKRFADNCPATCFDVNTGTGNALLPGNNTFINPFLFNGNCLDTCNTPIHQVIYPYSSGQGTVYWATVFSHYGTYSATSYEIFGDGYGCVLSLVIRP
jgi:hypothetical protein